MNILRIKNYSEKNSKYNEHTLAYPYLTFKPKQMNRNNAKNLG